MSRHSYKKKYSTGCRIPVEVVRIGGPEVQQSLRRLDPVVLQEGDEGADEPVLLGTFEPALLVPKMPG